MILLRSGTDKAREELYVIYLHAYDVYSKTEPTYAQYYCLFINFCLLVHLPDMFRQ
jgi:hypothetical protein